MKKSLLSFVLLSIVTGAACAQSVSLYGIIDAGLAFEDTGAAAGKTLRLESGGQSTSRFGLRGTEDLGGGLSALFQLESGFVSGTGVMSGATTGQLFNRHAWLGLRGGFGTVRLGRVETPIYAALGKGFDPFGRGLAGNIERVFTIATSRTNNTLGYTSPKFNGLSGDLTYGMGGVAGAPSQGRDIGLSVQYLEGPLALIYAHHNANSTAPIITTRSNFAGATYDFAVMKAYLAYGDHKNDHPTAASRLNLRTWLIGATMTRGPHLFIADYIRKTDKEFADRDANQVAVGYTYTWSKRTNFYTAYSHTTNGSAGLTNVAVAGATGNLLQAGIRHTF
jgi:predicted porin